MIRQLGAAVLRAQSKPGVRLTFGGAVPHNLVGWYDDLTLGGHSGCPYVTSRYLLAAGNRMWWRDL